MKTNEERTVMLVFNNGEHLVGKEVESDIDGVIVLEDPVNLIPDPASGKLMFFSATQFAAGSEMEIYTSQLRCAPLKPNKEIFAGYDKQFGVGIVTPGNGNIISM